MVRKPFNKNIKMKNKISTLALLIIAPLCAFSQSDTTEIKKVMSAYIKAIEKLDATNTDTLFTENSQVVESGSVEGKYKHYLEHHLNPELGEFSSFTFSNYAIKIEQNSNTAFATETYEYLIVLKADGKTLKRKGVATSVLMKKEGKWKIHSSHSSSRK